MTLWQALILGIIQGLTEFLPISSSAHLVLTPYFLRWELSPEATFVFDVIVQMGTLVAVIAYFSKDLRRIGAAWLNGFLTKRPMAHPDSRLGWQILAATLPAGFFGIVVKNQIEAAFNSPLATGVFLLGTAGLLFLAERIGRRSRFLGQMNWMDAFWIGAFQALAVFPGISRSGASIAGGLTRHLDRVSAARFSFLMAIPIMLAAGVLALIDLVQINSFTHYLPVIGVGSLTSMVVGYFSIHWLLRFLNRRSLSLFAIYCFILGGLVITSHWFAQLQR